MTENMINEYLLMSLKQQTSDFFELVKTKAIEVLAHQQEYERLLIITTIVTLFFGCYLIVVFSCHLWKKRKRVFTRSMSIGVLHGGELALQRLVDYHEAKANFPLLNSSETELDALLNVERPHFKELQRCTAKMEMSGKERHALMKLEAAVREARSKGKPHEAYEFEMLLVETLIYQGEFSKALSCQCLQDKFITDARRPLYNAILYLLLGTYTEEAAKNCWREFKRMRKDLKRPGNVQDSQLIEISRDFNKFKTVVASLREDIQEEGKPIKINK